MIDGLSYNDEQRMAVEHEGGPLLVVAGAGTGKTRVVTGRVAALVEKGVEPSRILALTFTDKAAAEMEERVDRLLPYGRSTVNISTFHAFGDRLLRDEGLSIGLSPDFKVLTEAERVIFLKERLYELPLRRFRPLGDPTRYLSELMRFISRLKDEDVTPQEYLEYARGLEAGAGGDAAAADRAAEQLELAAMYARYEELMRSEGYLDFGDQVTMALRLLRSRPAVLERCRARFDYIMADEFQDTNYAQFELLKLLAEPSRNIMVVADDDQSIYKFRGAAVTNVMAFIEHYPEAKVVTLKVNYRSVQPVLDAAYRLIRHNDPDRLEVQRSVDKRLVSAAGAGAATAVRHLHFESVALEAGFVADEIARRIGTGGGERPGDFAVLVRANADAEPFLRAMDRLGLPYRFSGGGALFARPEIRLLLSFLGAVTDQRDSHRLYDLAASEAYAMNSLDLAACCSAAKAGHRPLFDVFRRVASGEEPVAIGEEGRAAAARIVSDLARYGDELQKEPVGRVLYAFLVDSGILARFTEEQSEEAVRSVRNIARFFDLVTRIEQTLPVKSPPAFVEHLLLLIEAGEEPPSAEPEGEEAVEVMTVHKAKGLEFPVVFMVGLVEERFPRRGRRELLEVPVELVKEKVPSADAHLAEERRLFYVAMTRARRELIMTSAASYGGKRPRKVSPFVVEALGEAGGLRTARPEEAVEGYAPAAAAAGAAGGKGEREGGAARGAGGAPAGEALRLSYYQIEDYRTCPHKYRFVHILRVPLLPNHAIMYGKAVHEAISHYFRRKMEGLEPGAEELAAVLRSAWRSEGFHSKEHERERFAAAVEALERFIEDQRRRPIVPSMVEKSFSIEEGPCIFTGRWDLVAEGADGPSIIDFKTSDVREQKKADEKARRSLQLSLYCHAFARTFGSPPARAQLYFVESGLVGTARFDERSELKARTAIEEAARGIGSGVFDATPNIFNCARCAYGNICSER
ncbi:MAG TPA: ATP-dependent helicase [Deltaproteobacteria bacterium]|nr:ATP-dependent helicase [Deltaproteobacteria bacterium]